MAIYSNSLGFISELVRNSTTEYFSTFWIVNSGSAIAPFPRAGGPEVSRHDAQRSAFSSTTWPASTKRSASRRGGTLSVSHVARA